MLIPCLQKLGKLDAKVKTIHTRHGGGVKFDGRDDGNGG
jgi:hypothetical protein